jgi:hypothetical protein
VTPLFLITAASYQADRIARVRLQKVSDGGMGLTAEEEASAEQVADLIKKGAKVWPLLESRAGLALGAPVVAVDYGKAGSGIDSSPFGIGRRTLVDLPRF